jgi:NDP-sugar pyrophosphorylase family protein
MAANLLSSTPVVLLAGGLGTRLRPVVADRPKGLAPVGARSFLEIQIGLLRDQGARHFVLCVGHRAGQIQDGFGDGAGLGVRLDYSVEGERLLGTGGALKLAERFFTARALVLNGDTFFAADYPRLLEHHRVERERHGVLATLALARAADAGRYGNVLLDGTGRFLAGFREKEAAGGGSSWLSAGAYVLERDLLDRIPEGEPCSLECQVFPGALKAGRRLAAWTCSDPFFDIGTPDGLRAFTDYYRETVGPNPNP